MSDEIRLVRMVVECADEVAAAHDGWQVVIGTDTLRAERPAYLPEPEGFIVKVSSQRRHAVVHMNPMFFGQARNMDEVRAYVRGVLWTVEQQLLGMRQHPGVGWTAW